MLSVLYHWLGKEKDKDSAFGVIYGLVLGLIVGLAFGLLGGVYGLPALSILVAWLVLSEAVFVIQARWFEKKKYTIRRTLLKKAEALLFSGIILFNTLNAWWFVKNVTIPARDIMNGFKYLGITVVVLIIVYALVKGNQAIANTGKKGKEK